MNKYQTRAGSSAKTQSPGLQAAVNKSPSAANRKKQVLDSSMMEELKIAINGMLDEKFDVIRQEMSLISQNLTTLIESRFEILAGKVNELQGENAELKKRLTALETAENGDCSSKLMNEVEERIRRQNNLIVFNLQESHIDDRQESDKFDKVLVSEMLNRLDPDIKDESSFKCIRLGRRTEGQHRPIKVILRSREQVLNIMRRRREIADKNVRVNTDRTKSQRTEYDKVRSILFERRKRGETDLSIRYVSGKPIIYKHRFQSGSKN
jgi:hypothetical protein